MRRPREYSRILNTDIFSNMSAFYFRTAVKPQDKDEYRKIENLRSTIDGLDPLYKLLPKTPKEESPRKQFGPSEAQAILDSIRDKKINDGKRQAVNIT